MIISSLLRHLKAYEVLTGQDCVSISILSDGSGTIMNIDGDILATFGDFEEEIGEALTSLLNKAISSSPFANQD